MSFGLPRMLGQEIRSIVPWSRINDEFEILCAVNTDPDAARTAWVTIDAGLHQAGDRLGCLYSTAAAEIGQTVLVEARNGQAVRLTVPPAGFVVYESIHARRRLHLTCRHEPLTDMSPCQT